MGVLVVVGLCAGSFFAGGAVSPTAAGPTGPPPAPAPAALDPNVAAALESQHPDTLQSQCQLNGHSADDCLQAQEAGRAQLIDALAASPSTSGTEMTPEHLQTLSTGQLADLAAADTHITQATVDSATQEAATGLASLIGTTEGCIMQLPSLPDTILSFVDSSLVDVLDRVVSITHSLSMQDWTMVCAAPSSPIFLLSFPVSFPFLCSC